MTAGDPGRGGGVWSTGRSRGWLGAAWPMPAGLLDFLGWEQLTAAEQAAALAGAALGLAAWLVARALFGGGRHR